MSRFGRRFPIKAHLPRLSLLLSAPIAGVQYDTSADSGFQVSATSFNFNLTVANNSNRALLVSVGRLNGGAAPGSTVTFNSVSLTSALHSGNLDVFYLIAPATGTHSVAVTVPANPNGCIVCATSLYNADQNSPIELTNSSSDVSGTNYPVSIQQLAGQSQGDLQYLAYRSDDGTEAISPAAGYSEICSVFDNSGGNAGFMKVVVTYPLIAGARPVITWGGQTAGGWTASVMSIKTPVAIPTGWDLPFPFLPQEITRVVSV